MSYPETIAAIPDRWRVTGPDGYIGTMLLTMVSPDSDLMMVFDDCYTATTTGWTVFVNGQRAGSILRHDVTVDSWRVQGGVHRQRWVWTTQSSFEDAVAQFETARVS